MMRESPRKNVATQAQRKEKLSTKENGKVIDLEVEEGTKDINIYRVDPISRLPEYIRPCKGKVKVPKALDEGHFLFNTPLLLENVTFEGPHLA